MLDLQDIESTCKAIEDDLEYIKGLYLIVDRIYKNPNAFQEMYQHNKFRHDAIITLMSDLSIYERKSNKTHSVLFVSTDRFYSTTSICSDVSCAWFSSNEYITVKNNGENKKLKTSEIIDLMPYSPDVMFQYSTLHDYNSIRYRYFVKHYYDTFGELTEKLTLRFDRDIDLVALNQYIQYVFDKDAEKG